MRKVLRRKRRNKCRSDNHAANPTASNTKCWSLTGRKIRLKQKFPQVFALAQNAIDTNDNLFTEGGDSISAMQLLNLARRVDPTSTTTDFLLHNIILLFWGIFYSHLVEIGVTIWFYPD
ncbi:Phosphopantetheine-binding [Penicillium camemberti]|uniref:Phosphopantetheine-binding n=1 Tax=Penicillium camemberti (strain FM 013) TaxID=1429867 RepID=A0A0G4PVR2_PENC3|nr:Phosphopantetheine-binding [Penicillium camemberti]